MENTENKTKEENLENQPEGQMNTEENKMAENQEGAQKVESTTIVDQSQSGTDLPQEQTIKEEISQEVVSEVVSNDANSQILDISDSKPEEATSKPEKLEDIQEKEGKGGIIATIVIIVLAILLIYYFNQGKEQNTDIDENTNGVNITVNDKKEEGQVTITDQEDNPVSNNTNVVNNESESEKVKIIAYYTNTANDPGLEDCSKVYPLEIEVDKKYESEVVNTVRGMLFPLDEEFTSVGWASNFPAGTMLKEVTISDTGMAVANFTSALNNVAGSCRVTAIRAQITKTLLQFPYIKKVTICVDGNCNDDEILQP